MVNGHFTRPLWIWTGGKVVSSTYGVGTKDAEA